MLGDVGIPAERRERTAVEVCVCWVCESRSVGVMSSLFIENNDLILSVSYNYWRGNESWISGISFHHLAAPQVEFRD